jgi:Rrf2 family protein
MKFTTQEEYGLRCLVAIAKQGEDGFMTIPDISKAENLSASHVAKLLAILRRAGLIKSTRGQLGGYNLGRDPQQITLSDAIEALGGRLFDDSHCCRHTGKGDVCVHKGQCAIGPVWRTIQASVDSILTTVTVKELAERALEQERAFAMAAAEGVEPATV